MQGPKRCLFKFIFAHFFFVAIIQNIQWADENERKMHIHQWPIEIQLTHTTICAKVSFWHFCSFAWFCLRLILTRTAHIDAKLNYFMAVYADEPCSVYGIHRHYPDFTVYNCTCFAGRNIRFFVVDFFQNEILFPFSIVLKFFLFRGSIFFNFLN